MPANEQPSISAEPSPSLDGVAPAIDRRRFLAQLELAVGGVICGAMPLLLGGCAARARYVTPTLLGDRLAIPGVQVADGGVLIEDPRSDLPIYVRRTADGGYTAVSTRCGHRGCQVDPTAEKLVCPCHGSEYTFAGEILQGPTERPLARYRVTADAEMVFVHRGAPEAP